MALYRKVGAQMRRFVFERDNHRCQYCGYDLSGGWGEVMDHVYPVALIKGTVYEKYQDREFNLATACVCCNRAKSFRRLPDWHFLVRRFWMNCEAELAFEEWAGEDIGRTDLFPMRKTIMRSRTRSIVGFREPPRNRFGQELRFTPSVHPFEAWVDEAEAAAIDERIEIQKTRFIQQKLAEIYRECSHHNSVQSNILYSPKVDHTIYLYGYDLDLLLGALRRYMSHRGPKFSWQTPETMRETFFEGWPAKIKELADWRRKVDAEMAAKAGKDAGTEGDGTPEASRA